MARRRSRSIWQTNASAGPAVPIEQGARQRGAGLVERAALDAESPAGPNHRHRWLNLPRAQYSKPSMKFGDSS